TVQRIPGFHNGWRDRARTGWERARTSWHSSRFSFSFAELGEWLRRPGVAWKILAWGSGGAAVISMLPRLPEDAESLWATLGLPPSDGRGRLPLSIAVILGINVAVFFMHRVMPAAWTFRHLYTSYDAVMRGYYHTLLTSVFSHERLTHLAFNSLALYFLGPG